MFKIKKMINKLTAIYFSPTNTTKKVLRSIAKAIASEKVEEVNLAQVGGHGDSVNGDMAIIGVPVYSGRVPVVAARKIMKLKAENVPVVLVVVYGNREYEDALIELNDITLKCGFNPVAAASFIGEHSYSTEEYPIAQGRPDTNDLKKAEDLGKEIVEKYNSGILNTLKDVPGNRPYKDLKPAMNIVPATDIDKCDQCGVCVSVCPTQAITLDEELVTVPESCILCCACIKACQQGARYNDNENIQAIAKRLNTFCAERKEPTFIFS